MSLVHSLSPEQIHSIDEPLGKILVRALEKRDYETARDAEVASRLLGLGKALTAE